MEVTIRSLFCVFNYSLFTNDYSLEDVVNGTAQGVTRLGEMAKRLWV
jgi:hypothetical protein